MTPDQYKAAREKLGMTQLRLSKELGVTRVTVAKRETGLYPIGTEAMLALEYLKLYYRANPESLPKKRR